MTFTHFFKKNRALLLAACFVTLGLTWPQAAVDQFTKDDVVQNVTRMLEANAYVPGADFTKVEGYLASEKEKIDKAETEDSFRAAVSQALDKFGYSHIVLFTPTMVDQRRSSAAVGIGIMAQYKDNTMLVKTVFPSTPAEEAGLEPGDVIYEVNGKKPEHVGAMIGEEGDKVSIKFHKYAGGDKEATLTRRRFSTIVPPTLTWEGTDTAVLKVPTFDLSYDRVKVEELMAEARKSPYLILDLRNNGGGTVLSMCHLLGMFIPSDEPIGTFVNKKLVERYVSQTHGNPTDVVKIAGWAPSKVKPQHGNRPIYKGHLTVLVNGNSGSASEIAAQALKESLGSQVVGEKSAGKVLVSVMAQLPHGYQLQYPITDYVSAKGVRLENTGVTPDVVAKDPRIMKAGIPDEPLEAAVALMHRIQLRTERFGG